MDSGSTCITTGPVSWAPPPRSVYWLLASSSGKWAASWGEVNSSFFVPLLHTWTRALIDPEPSIIKMVAVCWLKIPVRALLCRWARGCKSHRLSRGELLCLWTPLRRPSRLPFCQIFVSVQCRVLFLRVLNCCPTCTTKHRIIAATRITQSCCRCWRPAVNLTHGQSLLNNVPKRASQGWVCWCLLPPFRFVSDWVYSGVFRDVYGEFMIQVNEEYLGFRGEKSHNALLYKPFGPIIRSRQ